MRKLKHKIILSISFLFIIVYTSFGQGARYTGEYKKSNPIRYEGVKNIVIDGLEISGNNGNAIEIFNSENVIIKNTKISSNTRLGIYLDNCKNVTVIDCTFENVLHGLLAHNSESIKFEYNDVLNLLGRSTGVEAGASMAQFDKCSGPGNSISYNVCENISGKSAPEDIINLYKSHGTASSPIMVKGNWIRGGGPSNSGGGIMLADYGGSYQIAEDNILVNPGQYGVAIAGGNNIQLKRNKVFGKKQSFTNVGLYATNWTEDLGKSFNIVVEDNRVNFTSKDGNANNYWFTSAVDPIKGKDTNKSDQSITPSILPDKIIGRARDNAPSNPGDGSDNNKPDVPGPTPPPVDGGGGNDNVEDPGSGPEVDPNPDEILDPSITIYLDRFKRICVNSQGRVLRTSNVSIYNEKGDRVHSQRLRGYHTVIRKRFSSGTYDVKVVNGKKLQNQQLIIK